MILNLNRNAPTTKAPDICRWTIDRARKFTELHEDILSLFDLGPAKTTPENALGLFSDQVHPDDQEDLFSFWATKASLFPTSQEFRYYRRDGSMMWLRSILIMKLENGNVLGTTHDISQERIQAKENEEIKIQLQKITKTSPSIIYVYDLEKRMNTYANRSLFDVLGYSQQEVMELGEQLFQETIHPDDLPQVFQHHANVLPFLQEGESARLEYRMKSKEKEDYIWLKSTEGPYSFNEEGKLTSIIGIAEDITTEKEAVHKVLELNKVLKTNNEQLEIAYQKLKDAEEVKRLYQELQLSEQKLNKLNQEMEELVYITSHDLSEPLRTVTNYLGLINREKQDLLDEESKDFLRRVSGANTRMKLVVNDLLSLSRIGRNSEMEEVDLNKVIEEVEEDLGQAIQESNAKIHIELLPVIKGNHKDLKRLFQNLISNSIKYQKEGISPDIKLSSQQKGDHWLIIQSDNGIGMDPNHSEKIFQPFQRLHLKSQYEGSGIGLSICRKVVEWHHGKIWVETSQGVGSTFFISLPK